MKRSSAVLDVHEISRPFCIASAFSHSSKYLKMRKRNEIDTLSEFHAMNIMNPENSRFPARSHLV